MGTKEAAEFYDNIIQLEKDAKEIKDEAMKAIESFAACNSLTPKGVLRAIRDRKEFLKDKAGFLLVAGDSDKAFDLFDYDPNGNLFE